MGGGRLNRAYWLAAGLAVIALIVFFSLDLGRFLEFERLQDSQGALEAQREAQPLLVAAIFFVVYVMVAALSLPGIVIMTLAGGAIFGVFWGTVLSSFASTLGATLTFLVARTVAREPLQRRFGDQLAPLNRGFEREGAFYLFALRLTPAFPFFVINAGMGLMRIRTWTYYWVSQLGMLPATIVFANAGTQISRLDGPEGIFSPVLIASLAAVGLFPLVMRWVLRALRGEETSSG